MWTVGVGDIFGAENNPFIVENVAAHEDSSTSAAHSAGAMHAGEPRIQGPGGDDEHRLQPCAVQREAGGLAGVCGPRRGRSFYGLFSWRMGSRYVPDVRFPVRIAVSVPKNADGAAFEISSCAP